MTTYEIIATVIAGLALAQPWVIKLFIRWFKKIKITFIPSSKLKLYYNKSGSYISIGGVIEAKNQPAVIKNISAKVVRLSNKEELSMDWSSFMVPVFQSVAGNSIARLVKLICKNEENLTATLTEQQKETFEKFKDCQSELSGLTERDAFKDGFILAVRIMVEAMEGLETVEDI